MLIDQSTWSGPFISSFILCSNQPELNQLGFGLSSKKEMKRKKPTKNPTSLL